MAGSVFFPSYDSPLRQPNTRQWNWPKGTIGFVASLGLTAGGMALLEAASLRENPMFWRNAGGYPVELRELILAFYYPGLLAYVFLTFANCYAGWKLLRVGWLDGLALMLGCALNGLLFAIIATVTVWNNVENLLDGLPLHFHPL